MADRERTHSRRWEGGSTRAWRRLRDAALERDEHRCTFVDADGERCTETDGLDVHHIHPSVLLEVPIEELATLCEEHHPEPDEEWERQMAEAAAAHDARLPKLDVREISVRSLREAAWNANVADIDTVARIRHSIETFGMIENLVVRAHPNGKAGVYEVLSGNHRLKILRRMKVHTAPCHIVVADDVQARLIAQALNRNRGKDDPVKLAALMDEILAAMPKAEVDEFLPPMLELPAPGRLMERSSFAKAESLTYDVKPIPVVKLGGRLEACCHLRNHRRALELMAGPGQLSTWYARIFEEVVRIDSDAEVAPDHVMAASDYIRDRLLEDGPFDLIDLDDDGSPHEELDALFTTIHEHPVPPFVLCVTDGLAHRIKMLKTVEIDLDRYYRWPAVGNDPRMHLKLPELLDHGVRARAAEAGYEAECISADWKPGKSGVYGSWTIGPAVDTRSEFERDTEVATPPEAYGAWRIQRVIPT